MTTPSPRPPYEPGLLDGRTALVTGAGSGIGAASATALAAAGADVVVTDVDEGRAVAVAKGIEEAGGSALGMLLDVADESAWTAVFAAATQWRQRAVTVLHNNAAMTGGPYMERDLDVATMDLEVWEAVHSVALRGVMLGCKHAVSGMIGAGGGSIVNTSSVKGATGSSLRTAYSTAKGGIDALTRVVATTYGKRGVRCNAVAPGIVETPGLRHTVPAERLVELEDAHLLPRLGTPGDIGDAVVFLASDRSAFVTGQVLAVDGGLTAHAPALSARGTR